MDVLTDVLNMLELKGWLSSRRELVPPWRYDFAVSPDSVFHVISDGNAFLEFEDEEQAIWLEDGDLVLIPNGHAHALYDDPLSAPSRDIVHLNYRPDRRHHIVHLENEPSKLLMLCGAFHFDYPYDFPLLDRLPKLIHIRQGREEQNFLDLIRLIARESAIEQPGGEVMLRRLTELLFIQVLRIWMAQQAEASIGWGTALNDQAISTALQCIHQSPARKWTVRELADEVALSRSAFSSRFRELIGEPPMTYLTRWRMVQAKRLLKNEVAIGTIAEMLGYDSEVAFRKAFKREIGMPPATYRKSGAS